MKSSAAAPLLCRVKNPNRLCVENPDNFGVNRNSKAGPAILAVPEMWNILFPKG